MKQLFKALLRFAARLLFRIRVGGNTEHLEQHPRLLVIANHESFLDGLLLGLLYIQLTSRHELSIVIQCGEGGIQLFTGCIPSTLEHGVIGVIKGAAA